MEISMARPALHPCSCRSSSGDRRRILHHLRDLYDRPSRDNLLSNIGQFRKCFGISIASLERKEAA